jgi:dihydrofolate reductase
VAGKSKPHLVIVAAVARNGVIGRDNALVWREPADQRRFRELTLGHPVLMGRHTWQSLPERFRPLPARRNIVISRDPDFEAAGAEIAPDPGAALALLAGESRVSVIGGAQVYAAVLPLVDEIELTEIDADLEGDVRFPDWPRDAFVRSVRGGGRSAAGVDFRFVNYSRA